MTINSRVKPAIWTFKNLIDWSKNLFSILLLSILLYTHVKTKGNPSPALINKGNVLHRQVIKKPFFLNRLAIPFRKLNITRDLNRYDVIANST